MSTYLQSLTLRLAEGAGRLEEDARRRTAEFLLSRQNPDGGFGGREGGSDLYYTGFALRGLAILGELDGEPAEKAAGWLKAGLGGQAAIIDFLSLLYGAMLLDSALGLDIFADAPPDWRERVAAEIERFRREDGGYAMSDEGASSSTYYTFLVLLCCELIGARPRDPEAMVRLLRSRQRDDGGFVEKGPMRRSGTNPTAAAIGALKILDALDDDLTEGAIDFLLDRQNDEGGLAANTRIPFADVLSTFTGLLTLSDLGAAGELDLPALSRFVRGVETDGGFRAGELDPTPDVEYTFYGLGALALLET